MLNQATDRWRCFFHQPPGRLACLCSWRWLAASQPSRRPTIRNRRRKCVTPAVSELLLHSLIPSSCTYSVSWHPSSPSSPTATCNTAFAPLSFGTRSRSPARFVPTHRPTDRPAISVIAANHDRPRLRCVAYCGAGGWKRVARRRIVLCFYCVLDHNWSARLPADHLLDTEYRRALRQA
ncbi:uncharacterized protein K452DRAFT_142150 [Aplosporella prunicola CBS 121167]|uniref:Uncharacterized protein n=1 Tax=Aplosporella prunicola CBS 121167 TaxID=1176127 RepID=A0A6A6BK05_9PEZI|nr:uncharacterized protein K452DRAFT_142150 [Aplosporella prunicola CBS 121167]KAF2144470.1 hypothetical protein K452DRAFT_142150 [Aplosporella prunicola CBS 121167]